MWKVLVWLAATVALISARPAPADPDVDLDSPQAYQYDYEVNVPETGDQKSHFEERDEAGVVVGNFQVVDPNGDLRKLFYRVEGNSGFVITDQQVMVGFAPPPPPPDSYSGLQAVSGGAQTDGGGAAAGDDALSGDVLTLGTRGDQAPGQEGFNEQEIIVDADPFRNAGAAGATDSGVATSESGGAAQSGFLESNSFFTGGFDGESGSSGDTDSSEEGGFSEEVGLSSGEVSTSSEETESSEFVDSSGTQQQTGPGAVDSGASNAQPGSSQTGDSQAGGGQVKPFEFHGPAFSFSIQRTNPNRFAVKEKIIGHSVEFNTHGGKSTR